MVRRQSSAVAIDAKGEIAIPQSKDTHGGGYAGLEVDSKGDTIEVAALMDTSELNGMRDGENRGHPFSGHKFGSWPKFRPWDKKAGVAGTTSTVRPTMPPAGPPLAAPRWPYKTQSKLCLAPCDDVEKNLRCKRKRCQAKGSVERRASRRDTQCSGSPFAERCQKGTVSGKSCDGSTFFDKSNSFSPKCSSCHGIPWFPMFCLRNDPTWHQKGKPLQNCAWVAKKPRTRCHPAHEESRTTMADKLKAALRGNNDRSGYEACMESCYCCDPNKKYQPIGSATHIARTSRAHSRRRKWWRSSRRRTNLAARRRKSQTARRRRRKWFGRYR